jgi:hypothetical protein
MNGKKYKIIYGDPPWSHRNNVGGSGKSSAKLKLEQSKSG